MVDDAHFGVPPHPSLGEFDARIGMNGVVSVEVQAEEGGDGFFASLGM